MGTARIEPNARRDRGVHPEDRDDATSGSSPNQWGETLTLPDGIPGFVFDEDDLPVGRVLDRREMLRLLGFGAPALYLAAGCGNRVAEGRGRDGTTTCTARPRLTKGPYYVDTGLNRSDIRADSATGEVPPGVPLALTFAVSRISSGACTPLEGALVDVWHCDARGVYSGVQDPNFGDTTGRTWLRGHQLTDAGGTAGFTTIFPGWYPGRASHIHFTIRSQDGAADYDFTSQLFFEESGSRRFTRARSRTATGETPVACGTRPTASTARAARSCSWILSPADRGTRPRSRSGS